MYFLFKNSLVKIIYLLIRCYKTMFALCNTNNTDRNGANKQNTCTHARMHACMHTHTHTHTHTHHALRER